MSSTDNARSKETEELVTHRSIDHHFILLYIGLAIELIISDHRLPSFCQSDVQEAGKLALKFEAFEGRKENILES